MRKVLLIIFMLLIGAEMVIAQTATIENKNVNGHEYVDLGLPSGTLWATCNIGASNPWDYGDYFAWGEIETKNNYAWKNYKYGNGDKDKLTKYGYYFSFKRNREYIDQKQVLDDFDDVAYSKWGSEWCIPTASQFIELKYDCVWNWITQNGKNGYLIKGPNGNSIFMPAAGAYHNQDILNTGKHGRYWGRSLDHFSSYGTADCLWFYSDKVDCTSNDFRYVGLSVRPVLKAHSFVQITFLTPTTSTTTSYNLRAGIKSSCKITNVSVSVNNARGIDVVVNDGNDFTLNRNLQLNYGSNTITVSVTNCAGTTTKNLVVNVQGNFPPQPSNRRVAIVIGNSNYPKAPLTNPVNDATDMAAILRTLGFDVTLKTDLTHSGFENALKNFKYKADNSDVALLYYAGHGMEIDGTNYLIPTDAPISDLDQLKYKSVNANYALQILSGAKKKIIILDACRNNPAMRDIMHGGLAVMSAPNAFFAYSTSPGKTAEDGTGRNSPYTSALLKALGYKNLTLPQLFQKVGQFVHATNPTQVPWTASSLIEDVIFNR